MGNRTVHGWAVVGGEDVGRENMGGENVGRETVDGNGKERTCCQRE